MTQRYTAGAIVLHWLTAALIIFNLSQGFFMEDFARPLKEIVVPLHISAGVTVLALTLLRIAWRLMHLPPPLPGDMPGWERTAALLAHGAFYVLMLGMTLTGWSIISAHPPRHGGGPMIWGLFHMPPISALSRLQPGVQKNVHEDFVSLHSAGAWIFLCLLGLHVAAALKHQFVDGHDELGRMGISRGGRSRG